MLQEVITSFLVYVHPAERHLLLRFLVSAAERAAGMSDLWLHTAVHRPPWISDRYNLCPDRRKGRPCTEQVRFPRRYNLRRSSPYRERSRLSACSRYRLRKIHFLLQLSFLYQWAVTVSQLQWLLLMQ